MFPRRVKPQGELPYTTKRYLEKMCSDEGIYEKV